MQQTLVDKIKDIIEPLLEGTEAFVVDVEVKGAQTPEVWVSLDKEEAYIGVDECTKVSRELSLLMDAHDMFNGKYRLNVSSPGLSKPLMDKRQYPKNVGRQAKVKYKDEENNVSKAKGKLEAFDGESITILEDGKKAHVIPFEQLIETKIIPSI